MFTPQKKHTAITKFRIGADKEIIHSGLPVAVAKVQCALAVNECIGVIYVFPRFTGDDLRLRILAHKYIRVYQAAADVVSPIPHPYPSSCISRLRRIGKEIMVDPMIHRRLASAVFNCLKSIIEIDHLVKSNFVRKTAVIDTAILRNFSLFSK